MTPFVATKRGLSRVVRRVELEAFARRARRADVDRLPALVLGDSHAKVFRSSSALREHPRFDFHVSFVPGATAMGAVNPNSATNALATFRSRLRRAPVGVPVITLLGEVDCGFVIWFRAEQLGTPVEKQMQRSLQNYESFLTEVQEDHPTWIVSAPLPTILDGDALGDVANARRRVRATLAERTAVTLDYNARLAEVAERTGGAFIDTSHDELDRATGVVRDDLRGADPRDHHLDREKYGALIATRLDRMF